MADVITPGWYPDPLDPSRRRRWDGASWTARVSSATDPDADPSAVAVAWSHVLAATPSPTAAPSPVLVAAETPEDALPTPETPAREEVVTQADAPVVATPVPDTAVGLHAVDPIVAAFGAEARPVIDGPQMRSKARRPLVVIGVAAAAMLIAGAAVAGAGLLQSDQQRPHVIPEQSYRDADAGFSVRYPDAWHVLRRDNGDGIRFAIGAPDAPTTETNTVSVVVGRESATLPPLHTLAEQLTETLREQLPGVRLESAERARVADAPGYRFAFRDPDATPPTQIGQYVGRTTSGRPLTVTVTIREPRTAPTEAELRTFVESLDPS